MDPSRSWPWRDVFSTDAERQPERLQRRFASQMDVPQERQFIGFEVTHHRDAMDSLKPGDGSPLGTPPAFRWFNFAMPL